MVQIGRVRGSHGRPPVTRVRFRRAGHRTGTVFRTRLFDSVRSVIPRSIALRDLPILALLDRWSLVGRRALSGSRVPFVLVATSIVLAVLLAPAQAASRPEVVVGVSVDGPPAQARSRLAELRAELTALLEPEYALRIDDDSVRIAGATLEGARRANDALLSDPSLDLVVGLGPLVSADLVARRDLPKPVIAPMVVDVLTGRPPRAEQGGSGVENLSYIQPVFDFAHDVERFREVVDFESLAVVAPSGLIDAMRRHVDAAAISRSFGVPVVPVEMRADVDALAADLAARVDAVYVVGPMEGEEDAIAPLFDALHAAGLPTFSTTGEIGVRAGALVGLTPQEWWSRLARRTALYARRILDGEPAAEMRVQLTRGDRLYLNMETARELGISPTFDLMSDAVLIGDLQRRPDTVLDLPQTVRRALETNRDVAAAQRELEAGREDVAIARAVLLPQVRATLGGRWIDEDRAQQGNFGAERSLVAGAEFEQVLWSERAWSGVAVEKHLLRALEASVRQLELDVSLEAASAYFDVLSAMAIEHIRRDNVRLTRTNLERAQVRERLGAASPAEQYRWESRLAQDQDALVTSIAQRNLAEIELNRVLHRELESKLGLAESDTTLDPFRYLDPRFLPYIDDPDGLRRFRAFAGTVAKENSPELAQLDATIAAQRRVLRSDTRSFYSPDVALSGDWTRTLERDGAGSALFDDLPVDDDDWELRLGVSLPLFEGAERFARRQQTQATILRLERERQALAERIEQRARSAVHVASASFTRIRLTRRAVEAARRGFDLVASAYAEGAVSIIDVLDAQNDLFEAEQQAASATYRFLSDVMEVERATGAFLVLRSQAEKDAIFEELQGFVAAAGGEED